MLVVPAVPAVPPSGPAPRPHSTSETARTDAAEGSRADASTPRSAIKPKARKDDFAHILHTMQSGPKPDQTRATPKPAPTPAAAAGPPTNPAPASGTTTAAGAAATSPASTGPLSTVAPAAAASGTPGLVAANTTALADPASNVAANATTSATPTATPALSGSTAPSDPNAPVSPSAASTPATIAAEASAAAAKATAVPSAPIVTPQIDGISQAAAASRQFNGPAATDPQYKVAPSTSPDLAKAAATAAPAANQAAGTSADAEVDGDLASSDTTSDPLSTRDALTATLGFAESTSWMSLRRIEAPASASASGDGRRSGSNDDDAGSPSLSALGSASSTLVATGAPKAASGAAGTTAATGTATANGIADAIAGKLDEAKANGRVDLHLQLDPPDLGKVRIQVTATDRQMSIRMVVQDDAARQTIQAQADTLRERLGNLGVSLGSMDVRQEGGSANPRQPADQSAQNAADGMFGAGRRSAAGIGALSGRRTSSPTATGVDVIV
jgi:flagellar hook-length control protein FliK